MKNKINGIRLFFQLFFFILGFIVTLGQLINNIIELGGLNFRYNRFSLNLKGDMIIDTSAYPGNNERRFFGLKKNGRPYFKDENNNETPFYSFFVEGLQNEDQQKVEAESHFIQITNQNSNLHGKEYLLSISRLDSYIELYDFENKNMSFIQTNDYFNVSIYSEVGTFIKANSYQSNENFDYIISFIHKEDKKYYFYIIRCAFLSNDISKSYKKLYAKEDIVPNRRMCSCFQTVSQKIVCLYQYKDLRYFIMVFDEINNRQFNTTLDTGENILTTDKQIFIKGIHLKDEIGVFIYYKSTNYTNPLLSIKYVNSTLGMSNYKQYGLINIEKSDFIGINSLNDIIKLNDTKFCFVSPTNNREDLNIVIFNLYNDDSILLINYYIINFFSTYTIKFYKDLRIFSYNDFISLAFSYCNESQCSKSQDAHFSSLIIFNYPNSTDENIDLIQYLYIENEKIENFIFNLEKNISYTIENNIFGYQYAGIKILNYPDNIILTYEDNSNSILKNSILERNKNLKITFESNTFYLKMNYTIEYAVVIYSQITTPNYVQIVNYNDLYLRD